MQRNQEATKAIVYAGVVGAAYAVAVMVLAPLSFGPLQFRAATLLAPIVLLNRRYAVGLAVGLALSAVMSPFGWYDWALMPIAILLLSLVGYELRAVPWLACLVMSVLSAVSVTFFPLHLGGGIPFWPTVVAVFVPQLALYLAGWYGIWRKLQGTI